MRRKKKFIIGGVVILLALGVLIFRGFSGGTMFYFEVNEVLAKGDSIYDETVKVNGKVMPGSVQQAAQGTELRFTITDMNDGQVSLPVFYKGIVPDTFRVDAELVTEGHLGADGVFQAHTLMPKCPSKYEPVK